MHFAVPARPFMERNAHVFLAATWTTREGRICVCTLCKLLFRVIYLAQIPSNPDSGLFHDVRQVCLEKRNHRLEITCSLPAADYGFFSFH